MNPIYILGTGIYSCLATNMRDLESALSADPPKTATPDAVPLPTKHQLCSLGLSRSIANRASQAEAYAFMAASQAMSTVFLHTNPDTRTLIDPIWNTQGIRLGVIVANDASTIPHAEAFHSASELCSDDSTVTPTPLPSRLALQCMTSDVSSFLAPLVGARQFAFTVSAACASSHLALHTAMLYLDQRLADCILVVGVSETGDLAHLAFNALGIDGVHPSGGAAAVLLATDASAAYHRSFGLASLCVKHLSQDHAAPLPPPATSLLPRITGFGISQSPNRVTPDVPAMTTAMNDAIRNAHLSPHDIDIILAHHSGSMLGDSSEDAAISEIYTGVYLPKIFTTKLQHGHEMWMSGLSQLVEAVTYLPPQKILCNSFAFGGTCSAFIVES